MSDWLDQMVGDWTFEGRAVPDRPDGVQTGTEHITRRGAWIVIEGDEYRFQPRVRRLRPLGPSAALDV